MFLSLVTQGRSRIDGAEGQAIGSARAKRAPPNTKYNQCS